MFFTEELDVIRFFFLGELKVFYYPFYWTLFGVLFLFVTSIHSRMSEWLSGLSFTHEWTLVFRSRFGDFWRHLPSSLLLQNFLGQTHFAGLFILF